MSSSRTETGFVGPTATFRLAPEYRRIGYYLVVGFAVIVAGAIVLKEPVLFALAALFLVPAVFVVPWALRLDQQGVWQREYGRWHLWSWEAFAGGDIRVGSELDSFVDPNKPWWSRKLGLGLLADADRAVVAQAINEVWKPPEPLPLPTDIVLRGWFPPGRYLHLTKEGIAIAWNRQELSEMYTWQQVARIQVVRLRHDRQDFRSLDLFLDGRKRPLRLGLKHGNPNWTGPAAEVIVRYLQERASADRFELRAVKGPPQTLGEMQWRNDQLNRTELEFRWLPTIVFALGSLALLLLVLGSAHRHNPLNWDWDRWLGFCLYGGLMGTMMFGTSIAVRSQKARIRADREVLNTYRSSFARDMSR
jgi:hypothetical protein